MRKTAVRLALTLLALALPAMLRAQAPDIILHNGKVLTVDSNFTKIGRAHV